VRGKTVLVTGANSGIGAATAQALAGRGARLVLACRDLGKAERVREDVAARSGNQDVHVLPLDLASFASIRALAASVHERLERLDVLVNNAGVFPGRKLLTEDGFEAQFGINHLGHFLLTHLLLDRLRAAAPARVITVTSRLHRFGSIDFASFRGETAYGPWRAYFQSKLANLLFSNELARRLAGSGVTSNALHPGGVKTGIMRDASPANRLVSLFFLNSLERGASTPVHLACSSELEGVTGAYFIACKRRRPAPAARDEALARRLWQESAALCGVEW
jgi:NAD(P)-dependent dehydrogenase (short-subunit alcohol dehydrogenase family)